MKAFTDYPFITLGDKEGEIAPIRECEVTGYDDDKYCTVVVLHKGAEHTQSIKSGYIYTEHGRYGDVPSINTDGLQGGLS